MIQPTVTRRVFAALGLLLSCTTLAFAQAPRRLALVIGNNAYPQMPLRNAVSDAKAMDRALRDAGFTVDLLLDASMKDFDAAIDRFVGQLRESDVAMFYYSGHGVQITGENYLVPVDFHAQQETDAKYQSIPASRVVDRMTESGVRLSIIVLDACRNNPFRSARSATRGLAPMDTGRGSVIAYATAPNQTADDNPGGTNGLFTNYVLEAMAQPGLGIEQVFSRARQKVYEASHGAQIPWLSSSVIGEFYFLAPGSTAPDMPPQTFRAPDDPKTAVADLLARYRRAYETMDVTALSRIYPTFSGKQELQRRFADLKAVAMALGVPTITVSSESSAKAVVLYSLTFTSKTGKVENTHAQTAEFTFVRKTGEWVIENVKFK